MTRAVSASGSTIQNIQRQPSDASTAPPIVGPTAGATAMTMVMVPIVAPRRCAGTRRITEVISSGSITAVPVACTTRPVSRTPKLGARAATTVPVENRVSEARKIWRGVNRSSRNPVVGMTTAIVSRNPLVSHCAVVVGTFRSTLRSRSATLRMVSLRIITKAETTSTPISRVAFGAGVPGSESVVGGLTVSVMGGCGSKGTEVLCRAGPGDRERNDDGVAVHASPGECQVSLRVGGRATQLPRTGPVREATWTALVWCGPPAPAAGEFDCAGQAPLVPEENAADGCSC